MSSARKLAKYSEDITFSLSFLEKIFSTLPDPVFVKDANHRWIFGNEAFAQVIGLPLKDYLYKSDYDIFPAEIADVFWKKDDEIFKLGVANENEEFITSRGELRTILTKKIPILTDQGMILVGIIRDVTERKALELENIELNTRLTLAMKSLNFGVWEWDCATHNVKLDSIAALLLDLPIEHSVGSIDQMTSNLDANEAIRLKERLQEALLTGGSFQEDFRTGTTLNGRILRTNATVMPKNSITGHPVVVGTLWDVTQEYEQKKQLLNAAQISTLSEMAAGLAHDINNPISILKGRIQQLQKNLAKSGKQDGATDKIVSSMLDACERASKVVVDLRKLSAENDYGDIKQFDARDLFVDISELFTTRFKRLGIEFQVDLSEGPNPVYAIENQIKQAIITLTNYSFNSVYSRDIRKIRWTVRNTDDCSITMSLGDSGADHQESIHQISTQKSFSSNALNPSFGLGVTMAQNIISANGGKWIHFQHDSTQRFVFQLPATKVEK